MPSCAARNCTNRNTPEVYKGVRLHRFPLKQNERLQLWLQRIGRPNWTPKAGSRLCSIHFEEECFYTATDGRVHLTETAVPSIFSLPESLQQRKMKGKKKIGHVSKLQVKRHDQACQTDTFLADHTYYIKAVKNSVHHNHTVVPAPSDVTVGVLSEDHGSEMQGGRDHRETDNALEERDHLDIKEEDSEMDGNTVEEQGIEQQNSDSVGHDHCHFLRGITNVSMDHPYILADSPRTLKRKFDAVQNKLQRCRKRIKLQRDQINRLKRKVTSLSSVILELRQTC